MSFLISYQRPLLFLDWRRPPHPVYTADYSTYVQILTWFLDSPSPLCPFSVHRMALAGKELGKDVGQWFGPSTAAGAIKCVNDNALIIPSVVDLSSEPLYITSRKHRLASPSPSTVRSFRPMYTQPPTHQPAHLETAGSRGADVQSSCLLVFVWVSTVLTLFIMTR